LSHKGPGQSDLLPLPHGQLMASVKPAPEHGLVTVRQTLNDGMGPALPGRFDDSVQPVQRFDLAESDVLAGRQVIAHEVLKDDADSLPQVERVQLANLVCRLLLEKKKSEERSCFRLRSGKRF